MNGRSAASSLGVTRKRWSSAGIDAEAHHPDQRQHDEAARDEPEPRPRDLDQAGDRAQRGEHGQHAETGSDAWMSVYDGAEHDAAGREDQLEAVEPEPDGLEGEQHAAPRTSRCVRAPAASRGPRW